MLVQVGLMVLGGHLLVHVGLVMHRLVTWCAPVLRSVKVRDWFPFSLMDGPAGAHEHPAASGAGGRGGRGGCGGAWSCRPWGGQGYVACEVSFLRCLRCRFSPLKSQKSRIEFQSCCFTQRQKSRMKYLRLLQ